MKKILLLLWLGCSWMNSFSQDSVYVEITNWAGGVCCSQGTIYTITFTTNRLDWEIDSVQLELDGIAFPLNYVNSMKIGPSSYRMQFSTTTNYHIDQDMPHVTFMGINSERIHAIDPPYELFRIWYKNGKIRNAPLVLTRNSIAYP